jgi:hypothetical protein
MASPAKRLSPDFEKKEVPLYPKACWTLFQPLPFSLTEKKRSHDGVQRVTIDTNNLIEVHPFGQGILEKRLSQIGSDWQKLLFASEKADLVSPQDNPHMQEKSRAKGSTRFSENSIRQGWS